MNPFSEKGLSNNQAKKYLEQYGLNVLPEKSPPPLWFIFLSQLKSPLVYILLIAGFLTVAIGDYADAVIIMLAVLLNTILGFFQEAKASNSLRSLKHYLTQETIAIREGIRTTIDATTVVPGDIVILEAGGKIPADGKLISANRFYVDESMLTGESYPVEKQKENPVFMGTIVSSGQAVMKVESTGKMTKMGSIALRIQEKEEKTPLQNQLGRFSQSLVIIIICLTVIVFFLGLLRGFSLQEIFLTAIALAVSSIPEGLLVSLTVILAIGMQKILKRQGLVKKLSAAETLGGVTVLCIDKTGTLTEGKMKVADFLGDRGKLALQSFVANDQDDPLVVSAYQWGNQYYLPEWHKYQRIDSLPFDSKKRYSAYLFEDNQKENILFINGAPENILKWTTLNQKKQEEIQKLIDQLTQEGKRLVGYARKKVDHSYKRIEDRDVQSGLEWVGILAFYDPIRAGVKEALSLAIQAGIRIIVITGDYAKTAQFVLAELGMPVKDSELLKGEDLEKLSFDKLAQEVQKIQLFARTTPDLKLKIVEALIKNGEVVGMMGDGINDAPALHRANIGIAVNEATDVAKESADLILLDSNFSTIISAVEEGRTMFENIRKVILYLLSDAFAEIVVILGGLLIGLPLPVTAIQILWINLVSDGFPNLALTIDSKRKGIMEERPRSPTERLMSKWMLILVSVISFISGIFALIVFIVSYRMTNDLILARSFTFIVLGVNSLAYVFSVRSLMVPFWKDSLFKNRWLNIAVLGGLALQFLPFSLPFFRDFFRLSTLGGQYWLVAVFLSLFLFVLVELFKYVYHFPLVKKMLS